MNTKIFKYYLFGSMLTIVVFFSAAELLTRTISWIGGNGFTLALHELDPLDAGIEEIYQWHPFTGITFRPSISFKGSHPHQEGKASLMVDQYGFLAKDHKLSFAKAKNEIRIATIGASTTANISLTFQENWPGGVGTLLQQVLPDKKITVINASVPGFDTAQSIANLALRVMPFHPDIVIIYHGYNDLRTIRPDIPFSPDYSHIHSRPYGYHDRPPLLVRWLNHSMFYVRARHKYRKLVEVNSIVNGENEGTRLSSILVEAERAFEQHVRALVAIARSGGTKVVLSSFATLHDPNKDYSKPEVISALSALQEEELYWLLHFMPGLTIDGIFDGIKRYNAILERVANEEGTGWVDNAKKIPHRDEFFLDRVHFSPKGAARMAENLLPVALEQLNWRAQQTARAGSH